MGKDKKPRNTAGPTPADAGAGQKPIDPPPDGEGIMTTDAHVEGHGVED